MPCPCDLVCRHRSDCRRAPLWVVFSIDGTPQVDTLAHRRKDAVAALDSWADAQQHGATVRKVRVTPIS